MENNKAKLIIFTGPSGVGKGTILSDFFSKVNKDGKKIVYSISNTTRRPREKEIDGVHYFFTSIDDFKKLIDENSFLEWAVYSGNYYGTNKKFVDENLKNNISVLLEIELQGALNVMEKCKDALSIFVTPPNFEELEKRLRGRHSEDEASIQKRLEAAKVELGHKDKFDYIIVNEKVDEAVENLIKIFNKETNNA